MQIIFHIDLNAFFASAEESVNPSLKGKPLVVGGNSRRGIVTTASYAAREYGIHSAMPIFKAKELCPQLIILESHFDLYRSLSHQFFEIIATFSKELEVASIDECYVDMTEYIQKHESHPYEVAQAIQKKVYEELKLDCSIGIAPNKFLAKMASDMKKPRGITLLTNSNYKELLWPLPIKDMWGVGKKTQPKLEKLGIKTIGDIANYANYDLLRTVFGKNTLIYYHRANGKDFSKIDSSRNQLKSVGHSTTFERDSNDEEFIKSKFYKLSGDVSKRAKKRKLISNSISITLKYTREKSRTKQMIIKNYTNDQDVIYATALLLFESIYHGEYLRLVGVSMHNVISTQDATKQVSLFDYSNKTDEANEVNDLIEQLNNELEANALKSASSLLEDDIEDVKVQNKYLE